MTVPNADLAHSYALECLVCGTTPDQVPNLHHGSDLNNLQAHMMDEHGFTWDDWQTPDWVAKNLVFASRRRHDLRLDAHDRRPPVHARGADHCPVLSDTLYLDTPAHPRRAGTGAPTWFTSPIPPRATA